METISGLSGFARLLLLTIVSFFALNFLSLLLVPEHGCISLRGIYWAFIHIAFLVTVGFQMALGKIFTVRKLIVLFAGYALLPYAIGAIASLISILR